MRDANTPNGSRALEPPSNPAVPSHGSTLRGTALDHAFHPTRETRGPRCQDPDNGGHESCGHDWTMPHSRHCERWVAENLQNSDLLPMTQVTLKAANGLEIPYSGVVTVDLELLGQKCEGVPV